jgi:hypothetical protein
MKGWRLFVDALRSERGEVQIAEPPAAPASPAIPDPEASPSPDWRSALPEDLKSSKSLERYKDVPALAKAYLEVEKKIGTPMARPGADAKPEDVARWREANGVPAAPDAYEFPEGADPKAIEAFRSEFHKLGIPADAAKTLAERWVAFEKQRLDGMQQEWVGELTKFRSEWGEPVFKQRVDAALRFQREFAEREGIPWSEVKAFWDSTKLGDHPLLFRILSRAGMELLEDGFIEGEGLEGVTEDQVKEQIAALKATDAWKQGGGHRDYQRTFDKVMDLYKQIESIKKLTTKS